MDEIKRMKSVWGQMKQRCYNSNSPYYYRYGGRGIKVCDRWLESFDNFYQDLGERPSINHSLDRIDNDGNYEPSNCRWATREEQAQNKEDYKLRRIKAKQEYEKFISIRHNTRFD